MPARNPLDIYKCMYMNAVDVYDDLDACVTVSNFPRGMGKRMKNRAKEGLTKV